MYSYHAFMVGELVALSLKWEASGGAYTFWLLNHAKSLYDLLQISFYVKLNLPLILSLQTSMLRIFLVSPNSFILNCWFD